MTNIKKIAVIGFGHVGRGFYEVYTRLNQPGSAITAIAERSPEKLPEDLRSLFRESTEVVTDPEIDLVVEVTNSAAEAFDLVQLALLSGKSVVSANKKMLACHLESLHPYIEQGRLRFEAAACASIPVFRILECFYREEKPTRIRGIFNGTCNYLLSRMEAEASELPGLISDAQRLGFAEADPTDDVEGHDTRYKLILLAFRAWGVLLKPADIAGGGISAIRQHDVAAAIRRGERLKLVGEAAWQNGVLTAAVGVQSVAADDPLYSTTAENNILQVYGDWSGPQHYVGRGAGSLPTAKAVLQDVCDALPAIIRNAAACSFNPMLN